MSSSDNDANKRQKTVSESHEAATPPLKPSGNIKTMVFKFPNFASLPHGKKQLTKGASKCHGYHWIFQIYPGGNRESNDGYVALYLGLTQPGIMVKADVKFRCGNKNRDTSTHDYRGGKCYGLINYCKRDDIVQFVDTDGSLTVEVDLDIFIPRRETWYPKMIKDAPLWSGLYDEQDEANAEFDINGKIILLHKVALKVQAPGLYELVEETGGKGAVPVTGIDSETFAVIHHYIYTVLDVEAAGLWDSLQKTQSILHAADKFGCTSLKLYAESVLTNKFLMPDTCAALLVMADSHSCPLLKEAAKDMYKQHSVAVFGSDEWKNLMMDCPKLLNELLYVCSVASCSYDKDKVETWDVPMLRKKLQDANLDLDGSKDMLVKRWKNHEQNTKN